MRSARNSRARLGGCLAVAAAVFLTPQPWGEARADAPEADLRPGFLLNFAKYVEWPADGVPQAGGVVNVCMPGDAESASAFSRLNGASAQGRTLNVVAGPRVLDSGTCNLVFVSRQSERPVADVLRLAARTRALTVGDTPGFAEAGGMLELVIVNDRYRFDVNQAPARKAGLRFSSQLLRLARNIHE